MSMHTCPCCGKQYGPLPPGAWLSMIAGWHRVRIHTENELDPNSGAEIGCSNDPAMAAEAAWDAWTAMAKRMIAAHEAGTLKTVEDALRCEMEDC
jgi:hypothetical protein